MATAIVSGRVDEVVKAQAARHIHAAGMSVGDVIKAVWEHIAETGEVPSPAPAADSAWRQKERLRALWAFRDELPHKPELIGLGDAEMRALIAERYVN